MQTLSLALISMKKRCDRRGSDEEGSKAEVMADLKKNLPIEMNVNDLYGLSQSVTNISQRGLGEDDGFGSRGYNHRSQISVYEDVN